MKDLDASPSSELENPHPPFLGHRCPSPCWAAQRDLSCSPRSPREGGLVPPPSPVLTQRPPQHRGL